MQGHYPGRATTSVILLLHAASPVKKEHKPITRSIKIGVVHFKFIIKVWYLDDFMKHNDKSESLQKRCHFIVVFHFCILFFFLFLFFFFFGGEGGGVWSPDLMCLFVTNGPHQLLHIVMNFYWWKLLHIRIQIFKTLKF